MNLVDVLIIGFVLLGALHGYQRGFITSIIGLLCSIVGFLVASKEYMVVLHWAEQYFPLKAWVEPVIYRAILPSVQAKADTLQQRALGNILGALPPEWRSIFENLQGVKLPGTIEQVTHNLAGMLTENVLALISFAFVFYIVIVIIHLLVSIFLRPLGSWSGSINHGGGLVLGGLSTLIVLSVMAGLISPFLRLGVIGSSSVLIQNSYLYPYLTGIFHALDQAFSAQLNQKLLEPLSQGKGVWY
ncbi:MAG: CvpA family protein [Bacillota bacterium]|nr:CvpA family protein [Bacillota bacterium]MDP4159235.1 CvpA family protein [Bacillota bacterium]